MEKIFFTIGEISRLYNIPAKTLRYYDSVNLFSPSKINPENSYRYYSIDQFEMLNSIKYLRHMGFSIEDIKKHLNTRDSLSFKKKLEEYRKLNEAEIRRLKAVTESLDERIQELEEALHNTDFGTVRILSIPDRKILKLSETYSDIEDLELNLKKLENRSGIDPSIIIGRVGLTVSLSNLKKGCYSEYNSIFILQNSSSDSIYNSILPGGEYVSTAVNSGDHSNSPEHYENIFKFLDENRYEITGDAVERVVIDSFITSDKSEHLTYIEIPVNKLI